MGNDQKPPCHRGPHSEEPILLFGMIRVISRNAQWISKDGGRLTEGDTVLS
jgi:hypothetical protein